MAYGVTGGQVYFLSTQILHDAGKESKDSKQLASWSVGVPKYACSSIVHFTIWDGS